MAKVYVVAAIKNDLTEFWAATTSREEAVAQVKKSLPGGWTAVLTGWCLPLGKDAALKMRANSVRRLKQAP